MLSLTPTSFFFWVDVEQYWGNKQGQRDETAPMTASEVSASMSPCVCSEEVWWTHNDMQGFDGFS